MAQMMALWGAASSALHAIRYSPSSPTLERLRCAPTCRCVRGWMIYNGFGDVRKRRVLQKGQVGIEHTESVQFQGRKGGLTRPAGDIEAHGLRCCSIQSVTRRSKDQHSFACIQRERHHFKGANLPLSKTLAVVHLGFHLVAQGNMDSSLHSDVKGSPRRPTERGLDDDAHGQPLGLQRVAQHGHQILLVVAQPERAAGGNGDQITSADAEAHSVHRGQSLAWLDLHIPGERIAEMDGPCGHDISIKLVRRLRQPAANRTKRVVVRLQHIHASVLSGRWQRARHRPKRSSFAVVMMGGRGQKLVRRRREEPLA